MKVVKISQKIGLEKFVNILRERPEKVVISNSILDQVKSLRLTTQAIREAYKSPVKIEVVKKAGAPEVIEQEWMDPFIQSLAGSSPPKEIELEIKLLEKGAVSVKKAVPLRELDKGERKLLNKLIKMEHVLLTPEARVHLTELGVTVARGAKKIYG